MTTSLSMESFVRSVVKAGVVGTVEVSRKLWWNIVVGLISPIGCHLDADMRKQGSHSQDVFNCEELCSLTLPFRFFFQITFASMQDPSVNAAADQ